VNILCLFRGGEGGELWKRVSIVLEDSEKYFSGTFRCDEVIARSRCPKIFSPTVHLQSHRIALFTVKEFNCIFFFTLPVSREED
jgi:hypothetical protein